MTHDGRVQSSGSGIDQRIAALSPEKRALLAERLAASLAGADRARQPVPLRDRRAVPSFGQQRLWFLDQLEGGGPIYNVALAWWVEGDLDVERLRQAADVLIARHESLRTVFVREDEQLWQQVLPELHIDLPVTDVSAAPIEQARAEALSLAQSLACESFDLGRAPLLRLNLLRAAESTHLLVLVNHHIVSDAWSVGVFYRELSALYADPSHPLPALPFQYADYAAWQRAELQGERLEAQLAAWRSALSGLARLDLPTDRPRPPIQSHRGASHRLPLPAALLDALRRLCLAEQVTLYMLLLAAFQVLLGRYSGQEDIAVGSPTAARTRREFEGLIGFLVNTLVLRTDLSGNPRFRDLLHQVRHTALDAYTHQDVPFDKLVEVLHTEHDASRNPLVQALFVLQNAPGTDLTLPHAKVTAQDLDTRTSKFDLTVEVYESRAGLETVWEYATDLFDSLTIARMAQHYQRLLEAIVADPTLRIGELPLITEAERTQCLVAWRSAGVRHAADRPVHQCFEAQAAQTPQAVAVVCDGSRLTYAELDARANQLAHYLQARGVGPEVLVGLCLDRSIDLIVGVLGILKAGGAYLPLDPGYPPQRLAFMLADAQVPLLVTDEAMLARMPEFAGHAVCMDRDRSAIAAQPVGTPRCDVDDGTLAYVIYTSGSTGTPKGVMVTHGNVARLFPATQPWLRFDSSDTWTCFHSIAFDFSVWEIWGALVHGARLVVVPHVVTRDPEAFHALLLRERVTVLSQTPSAFHQLSAADASLGAFSPLTTLRVVVLGGEALEPQALRGWFERHGDARPQLVNLYGITETTVHVTCRPITRADLGVVGGSRIGVPISDLRVYILDQRLQPVPIGVPGEIVVSGRGTARGYLHRPELTAARFVADPFAGEPGARMYRSGDCARRMPDGDLEFLGRLDDQVKIRGFRIEPGEIEAVLTEHPGVGQAVLVAREDLPGDKRLVAYFVPTGTRVDNDAMRAFVRARLPDYMRPSAYVELERLPLTAHGKVDRKALPPPGRAADTTQAFVPPVGPTETILAGMWADLLKLERVGRHDHFFELGGHSLLAVSLLDRMRHAGLPADVRTLFVAPTLADLASAVDAAGAETDAVEVPPNRIPLDCDAITPEMLPLVRLTPDEIGRIVATVSGGARNIQDIYPLAPLQEGILFHHAMATQGDPYLLSFLLGFDSRDRLNQYLTALQAVIDRHDILRTSVVREGLPEPVQVVWRTARLVIEEVDVAGDPPTSGDAERLRQQYNPQRYRFDVHQAPLVRAFVTHDRANGRWLLLQLAHHLAIDHTTEALMQEEIQARLTGRVDDLPASVPFRDFVAHSRLRVPREEHARFFGKLLGDVVEPTTPFGLTDAYGDGTGLVQSSRQIGPSLARRLRERARSFGVSAAALCHVAWAQVLARASGQDDVVFGTVLFGRMHGASGTDRALGLFINTLPIRIHVGDGGADDAVRRTHDLLAQMLQHEHAPLALAQRCSQVAAPAPLFSALLNYRHRADLPFAHRVTKLVHPGVELLHVDSRTNYPLTLSIDDEGEGLSLSVSVRRPIDAAGVCALMATALERLVGALEDAPATPVGALDVQPESERRRLVLEWNETVADYPGERGIHRTFEEQAARTPDAIAIVADGGRATYAGLNARANQLAHHLRARGAGPGAIVAISLDRGIEMVVALVAILKAGAAYLPLEPDQPTERAERILADAAPCVLLTERRLLDAALQTTAQVVCLDEDAPSIAQAPHGNPPDTTIGGSVAYVLYTSGSTGMPKGVAVPHRAVARLVVNTNYVVFDRSDVVAQASNCSFDAATFEIWGALLHGATLVVIPRDVTLSPRLLEQTITTHGVTILFLTTGLFSRIAAERPAAFRNLRHLIVGGDVLDTAAARRVLDVAPPGTLTNGYGPTETTTFAATYDVAAIGEDVATVPIGRPIANTTIYLLDRLGRPSPVGVPGEIHIGGPGVADGYVNHPSLTREKFIPDTFATQPGGRLYRTGDLARYRADGNIEFLGRMDGLVKLRGFRVEPGEVEAALRQHPHVSEAAVVVRQDASGEKRLVAYVVASGLAGSLTSELRAFLTRKLPHYMVPSAFVGLEGLPLNPNGKVDRDSLPEPPGTRPDLATPFDEPKSDLERTLVAVWERVLGTRSIGVNDNFFDLGGNSLSALLLVDRIEQACRVALPPVVLFEAPTVAELAALLGTKMQPAPGSPLVAIQPQGLLPPLFCVHGGGGHVVGYADLARHLGLDQPVYGLQAVGLDGQRTPHVNLAEMAAEYISEITRLRPNGPYHLTGLSFGGIVAFEMACQLAEQGRRVGLLAILDSRRPGYLRTETHADRLENYARRFRYHATNIVLEPGRIKYVRRKMTTLKRLASEQFWRLVSKPFAAPGQRLPPALRRVADANWMAVQNYTPRPYRGKVTLFIASERQFTVHSLLDLGWGPYAEGGVESHEVEGNHSNLVNEPFVGGLADHLRRCLAQAN